MLEQMATTFVDRLCNSGFHVPISECSWGTIAKPEDVKYNVSIKGAIVKYCPADIGFPVLGTKLTCDDYYEAELTEQITNAWGAYHKHKHILKQYATSIRRRFGFLRQVVTG
eukprot:12429387-Karenia_brevis.AAC.1